MPPSTEEARAQAEEARKSSHQAKWAADCAAGGAILSVHETRYTMRQISRQMEHAVLESYNAGEGSRASLNEMCKRACDAEDRATMLGRAWRRRGEFAKVSHPADRIERPLVGQAFGNGEDIDRFVFVGQGANSRENELVITPVEVLLAHVVTHALPGIGIGHQSTQHRLLGLQ